MPIDLTTLTAGTIADLPSSVLPPRPRVNALDLIGAAPWLIQPSTLETLLAIAARANEGPEAVAARLGRPLDNSRTVSVRDGVALIPVTGPIFRRANLFTEISGATSVEILATDLATAAADPTVRAIVLDIDSPGGQATGISELAGQIRAIDRTAKPVTAYVDGMAASAAYWLASAAGRIVTSDTGLLGSIGVVGTYKAEKDAPIKIISSVSPLKQATPDTEAGRAEMQRVIDELGTLFVSAVATNRDTSPERVITDFGRGGVLVGAEAVKAGMADAVGTLESLLSSLSEQRPRQGPNGHSARQPISTTELSMPNAVTTAGTTKPTPAIAPSPAADTSPVPSSTTELAQATAPVYTALDLAESTATGRTRGITEERARIGAILTAWQAASGQALGLAAVAIEQGLSAEAATAMIQAHAVVLAAAPKPGTASDVAAYRAAWLGEGTQQVAAADSATGEAGSADDGSDPVAAATRAWERDASLRAEFGNDQARYLAFRAATAAGRVKILRESRAPLGTPSAA